jgi:hypothetical protein
VRRAGEADVEPLLAFVITCLSESALQPLSPAKIAALVWRAVRMEHAIAGIIEGDNGIEASVGLFVSQLHYTDEPHLRDGWLGVRSDCRRVNHGARLVQFSKWAQERMQEAAGRPIPLFLEIMTTEALEPKLRLYQRQIPQVGASFAWGTAVPGRLDQKRIGNGRAH